MKRVIFLAFSLLAYVVFLATFLYLIAFIAGLPAIPRSIDHPGSALPVVASAVIDLALVALFGLQHTLMARQGFKLAWTRLMPKPIERSGYMIFTCLALIVMFLFWQPLPTLLWDLRGGIGEPVLWAVFGLGWAIVLLSTFLINHFELFGLAQVWRHITAKPAAEPRFRQPLFYRLVRHPLYSGFLIAFWATPAMSVGHLLFAAAMTAYILIAIEFEERDLLLLFGSQYAAYRASVGKLLPRLR